MNIELEARKLIVEAGKKLYDRFFVASNDGNISYRLNDKEVLITPTGGNKGDVTPDQIVKVDLEGRIISGFMKPTSEMKMHLAVYKKRPDVKGIVHAHPPGATAFAACGMRMDQEVILTEVTLGLGRIGFAEYGTPSTYEIPRAVEKEIGFCDAILLANHGALTVGEDVMQAYYRMENLEMYARVLIATKVLGGARPLTQQQVEDLYNAKERNGWGKRK
jgi:L-fuculose-phosphate aldolase